ncbi:MAG: hypothetical protein O4861_20520 [Trichodesmium sp. St16_bin4-tuft]|nr:hypothetical protein [Trichodesmium sp. St4_bin8_1]MDE5073806.1 hypothetical protein [Trichodesmium sp. St5_bin8]MDE5078943.1 hypothetical protein [Trichodesmium sp. St2_bin6]MDE5100588.1 hypothetical protein [Trichodesmium sp. St16_bin4-tuft]MDE5104982.1 hypothetical protein [Trichodesmium sp. St19_bin2]
MTVVEQIHYNSNDEKLNSEWKKRLNSLARSKVATAIKVTIAEQ